MSRKSSSGNHAVGSQPRKPSQVKSRILRLLPAACLLAALASFVAFHFLPIAPNSLIFGWTTWEGVWVMLKDPEKIMRGSLDAMLLASFLTTALLIPTSPFLLPVIRKSYLAWLILSGSSLVAGLGFWIAISPDWFILVNIEMGFGFFFLAITLNFLGLATARLGTQPAAGNPHGFVEGLGPQNSLE